jgi:nucleoside-diphosphate-sugar epimerase
VSDIARIQAELGWRPTVGMQDGLHELVTWVEGNRRVLTECLSQG